MTRLSVVVFVACLACPVVEAAVQPVTIAVSPRMGFAPLTVWVKTTIERDAENRTVTIIADGEAFYRSSDVQIDGESGPRTIMLLMRDLPAGAYRFSAEVTRAVGRSRWASLDGRVEAGL